MVKAVRVASSGTRRATIEDGAGSGPRTEETRRKGGGGSPIGGTRKRARREREGGQPKRVTNKGDQQGDQVRGDK